MRSIAGLLPLLLAILAGCGGGGGGGFGGGISGSEAVIRGVVRDTDGNPVSGAAVSTFVNGQVVQDTSKVDGSFVLRFPLSAPTTLVVVAQKGVVSAPATASVRPGAETQINIVLQLSSTGGGGSSPDGPPPPPF